MEIEKGIPLPELGTGRKPKYPFKDLSVGESFLVKDKSLYNTLHSSRMYYQGKLGTKYVVRVVDNGIRVWRSE